jgi:copper resistance protein B
MTARAQTRFTDDGARLGFLLLIGMALGLSVLSCKATAQVRTGAVQSNTSGFSKPLRWKPPIADEVVGHLLFTQLEDRTDGRENELRWEGEGWIGTDMSRLWIKSEGVFQDGSMSDGDHEVLYDRPIPRLRYFDAQAGVRADLDSGPPRFWSAIGIEGLAPNFFELEPTLYFRDDGHVAGKVETSYDLRITQRLVAQPQLELNFYSKPDASRGLGTGLADLDTAIRFRYEIRRKLAPYVGFAYTDQYGSTAGYSRRSGEAVSNPRFVFGLRAWY